MVFISPLNDLLTSQSTSSFIVPIIKWLFPHASDDAVLTLHLLIRKTSHFLEYALLAFLLFRGFRGGNKTWRPAWVLYAGLIAIGTDFSMNMFRHLFHPGQDHYDWLIDSSGAVTLGTSIKGLRIKALKKIDLNHNPDPLTCPHPIFNPAVTTLFKPFNPEQGPRRSVDSCLY
jgi:VanZ family protein